MQKETGDPPFAELPKIEEKKGHLLLEGMCVVDLSTSIAGPYGTQLLADLGATVIKIEKPGMGDDARNWGPPFINGESPWFLSVNRNKHSLMLDLARQAGLEVLEKLLAQADALVVNMNDQVQKKLGIDYERLAPKFPRLIHASLTGFGLRGQRCHLPCYDLIAEGYSGVMDLTGEAQNDPQKVGTPAADLLAGQDVAMAVLAAYVARQRTGRGAQIDVSMQASMTRFMTPRLTSYLSSGELPRRSGGKDSVIAIYQVFDTADRQIALGLGNDAIWRRFWVAVGTPEVGENPRYASNADRRAHRDEIVEKIAGILCSRPRDEWLELLGENRIPAGPINRLDEVARDEDLLDQRFLYQAQAAGGLIPQVGLGIAIDGQTAVHRKPPPVLGEDTDMILSGMLNLSPDDINKLKDAGAV
ncbi:MULTISPECIES: CaiB/BaiF CoA transferase family protein [Alcaligenaceae]|uniref:CoA-transferase family III (CaiB/BaiF) protein n=1 Tax=Bordetella petrii (strain ATCC BAA-461 / DSM 12804 / CCUG 43448 / CIP 107267 / Se-1111R) TaxID=340100 RepID=A9ICI8_BORPD|nr:MULTISPECIES: CoA transferase [Alcaligenaceae]CAP41572.1 CoA-transferase family III (CaiB/BaiF) protein [Bordetella petrii]CUJ31429.1 Formyl-coenzyme A transferase [Achromobacter xylosoxidans]CUJ71502.1 Formyl-coenzyme A transferase [Achromobacter xylosoxidans]